MISLRELEVNLDSRTILSGVSFSSAREGVVALMGPSGCGKSTLLKALMGIHRCQSGELVVEQNVFQASEWNEKQTVFSLVPQVPLLLPWKTIRDNVAFAASAQGQSTVSQQRASELLSTFGLADAENLYPWQVSQGMAARASFARTLMIESQVLLLDEPFAAIDATTRFKLQRWLLETLDRLKIEAIMVTHDPREALLVADQIIILGGRPALVVEEIKLPERTKRQEPDWIFGTQAGHLEKQIRLALEPSSAVARS